MSPRIAAIVSKHFERLVVELGAAVRREIADDIRHYVSRPGVAPGGVTLARYARLRKIRPCIAPRCKNDSKGPRFHYLCDEHRGAPEKRYAAWREQKQKRQDRGKA